MNKMKSGIIFISLFIILIISACIDTEPTQPPALTVDPFENQEISTKKSVTYTITGSDQEDIVKFELKSTPAIFQFDTTFKARTHNIKFTKKLILPSVIAIPDDSTIYLDFILKSTTLSTTESRVLRIIKSADPITQYTVDMSAQPGGNIYYSVALNNSLSQLVATNFDRIDLGFVWTNDQGYVLCSPDAPYFASALVNSGLDYTVAGKNHTKFQAIDVDFSTVDAAYINEMTVKDSPIAANALYGSGVSQLYDNKTVAIQTQNGKKGVIKIISAAKYSNKIAFSLKIQK